MTTRFVPAFVSDSMDAGAQRRNPGIAWHASRISLRSIRATSLLVAALALSACADAPRGSAQPVALTSEAMCSLDGMLLADFPGPKAQIHYASGEPDLFCDTLEMFSIYLEPEQQRRVAGLFVQDMGAAEWERPRDHWIDARTAYYVHGSRRRGAMGPTMASFAQEAAARAFAREYGGHVMQFHEVTPGMVKLDGGALHDSHM